MGDRWMPEWCDTDEPGKEVERIRERFIGHQPRPLNFDEVKLMDRTGEKRSGWDVRYKATYVWLPVVWENGVPNINWKDEWKLEDYE
jgi:hypothetical protein